ncbi:MAG: hypothetical protein F4Y89_07170 [Gammaproteobacteria bacterium]|nr:hypothetical protein [Gammaproteobacteria bacterium]MYG96224.1 hypothetical protein [Gammaproteobacteria bacterium]
MIWQMIRSLMLKRVTLPVFFLLIALLTFMGLVGLSLSNAFLVSESGDSDGCIRPNYYQPEPLGVSRKIEIDADEDQMDDFWEERYALDPNDGSDYGMDSDGDGFTNREEYVAGTNPLYFRSYPGVIEVTRFGFNCFYEAEIGFINDDGLLDILIRDPSKEYLPAIHDFVLIQQADNSFVLEGAHLHELPELASIQESVVLAELNGDNNVDLVLFGLAEHIPGVYDQIVFAPVCELCFIGGELPTQHVQIGPDTLSFFRDLDEWILSHNGSYFDETAPVVATVPEVVDINWLLDSAGRVATNLIEGQDDELPIECNATLVRCFIVNLDITDTDQLAPDADITFSYRPIDYDLQLTDNLDDPDVPNTNYAVVVTFSDQSEWEVKDYSIFNQDALHLANNALGRVRESGVMFYPSEEAGEIYAILRKYLSRPIFYYSFLSGSLGTYRELNLEYVRNRDIIGQIQRVLFFTSNRFIREKFG